MKKIFLAITVIIIATGAYAQTDSANKRMIPPNINITDDGMNPNHDLNNQGSQNHIMNHNPDMNQNSNYGMENHTDSTMHHKGMSKIHADDYLMQNGKMMYSSNGKMMPLKTNDTLANGTKIMTNGSYMTKDGKKMVLANGQHLDRTGKIIPMKTKKDKNMYLVRDNNKKK